MATAEFLDSLMDLRADLAMRLVGAGLALDLITTE
jgi:hypothetical protein